MNKPSKAQNISFAVALICYFLALCCAGLTFYYSQEMAEYDPVVASLGATVVFFVGMGIVLHVIGKTNLPNLKVDRD